MPSRPNEYPRASAALSGLGLTAQLAATATDSIPIAKLVLGVVSRIITLAQDIEKSRDALHQLADSAHKMGVKIPAVVSGRKLSPEIERSLEAIYEVLRSIEAVFKEHKAKSGFRKALSYALTTKKRIDDLSQELSRATQELLWVTSMDTNAQVRDDSQYFGEFRRLRESDVDKLTLITERTWSDSAYILKYYTARIGNAGPVCVVRYFERKTAVESDGEDYFPQLVSECDQILERFSTVRDSHPNIARIYGRSEGDHLARFTVLKSGYIPISEVAPDAVSVERTWDVIVRIVDALCHLNDRGASWEPYPSDCVLLDHSGNPMIGLNNDLRRGKATHHLLELFTLGRVLGRGLQRSWETSQPDAKEQHALAIRWGGAHFPIRPRTTRCSIPRRFIRTLNERISSYLQTALASCKTSDTVWMETGPVVLRAAASGRKVGSAFYTQYFAQSNRPGDSIFMSSVEESDDELVHLTTYVDVPASMTDEFRTKLGITPPRAGDSDWFYSTRDPAEPGSMSFRPYPWRYQ